MRVLLDESLPRPFATLLSGHEVRTVAAMGWSGKQNGDLLRLAADSFDVLLTADRNLEHQQNLTTLPISVVVLVAPTNRIESLQALVPELLERLKAMPPRRLVHIGVNARGERPRRANARLRSARARSWAASSHSMTWSARASTAGGILSPSAFAVLRLITSSNLAGCSTGRSPGLAPLTILSTYTAARRNMSGPLAP